MPDNNKVFNDMGSYSPEFETFEDFQGRVSVSKGSEVVMKLRDGRKLSFVQDSMNEDENRFHTLSETMFHILFLNKLVGTQTTEAKATIKEVLANRSYSVNGMRLAIDSDAELGYKVEQSNL